jgi:flagellar basal-body rod protein FlgC
MSLFRIFDIAASALSAESTRLNLVASNLANAQSVSASEAGAYRARVPVFAAVLETELGMETAGVRVSAIREDPRPLRRDYRPGHPLADAQGYVYASNVNVMEEMTNMISASRTFQTGIEVMNSAKQMLLRTLSLGQ